MTNKFDTHLNPNFRNYDRYGRCRRISKPNIIGHFSLDQNREFSLNYSNCKYLKRPPRNQPLHLNLNDGYELVQHKPEGAKGEKLDHILRFILLKLKNLATANPSPESSEKFLHFDVICFRGKLRMLMCTPYEFRDGWTLLATKWKGNIYLCELETEEDKIKRQSQTEESKRICSYGFKFEQYMMSGELMSYFNKMHLINVQIY